jgi:uncharacterized membrane protein YdbT with pleckstrin-like domain
MRQATRSKEVVPMEQPDFFYRRKPAFISFLLVYLSCFGISFLLIKNSAALTAEIVGLIMKLRVVRPYVHSYGLRGLPCGIIIAFPLLVYGSGKLLWNVMTTYEITPSHIRLLAGSLSRREQIFPLSVIQEVTFTQTLLEVPFGVGSLILQRGGSKVEVKGVYGIKRIVDEIREKTGNPYR